jgi:hypothetical protein
VPSHQVARISGADLRAVAAEGAAERITQGAVVPAEGAGMADRTAALATDAPVGNKQGLGLMRLAFRVMAPRTMERAGQPFKNTAVRMPGPSWRENRAMLKITLQGFAGESIEMESSKDKGQPPEGVRKRQKVLYIVYAPGEPLRRRVLEGCGRPFFEAFERIWLWSLAELEEGIGSHNHRTITKEDGRMLSGITRVSTVVAMLFLLLSNPQATMGQSRAVPGTADLREMIQQFSEDQRGLLRTYTVVTSSSRRERLKKFYDDSLASLKRADFAALNQDGKIDYVVFQQYLNRRLHVLAVEGQQYAEMEPLLPFAKTIAELEDARRRMETPKQSSVPQHLRQW